MKIAIVSNIYKPYSVGGAEISTELLARGLQKNGHDVLILTSTVEKDQTGDETVDGVPVRRIKTGLPYSAAENLTQTRLSKVLWHTVDLWNPGVYKRIRHILRSEKPDVVHTNVLAGLSPSVWSAAHDCGIPVVHTIRDYYLLCIRSNLMKRTGEMCQNRCTICRATGSWKRLMSRKPRAVAAISRFVLDKHREYGVFAGIPAVVIPNPIAEDVNIRRGSSQIPDDKIVEAVYLGRLEYPKGPQVVLEALRLVPDLPLKLHLCGDGPLWNTLLEKYGDDKRVEFKGKVDSSGKDILLQSSDMMLVPSVFYEPFNRTVIEAYQYGLAVVASRIGGIPEIVEDGISGRLFEPGDSRQLADILLDLVKNKGKLTSLKKDAADQAAKYRLSGHVGKYEALYRSVQNPG